MKVFNFSRISVLPICVLIGSILLFSSCRKYDESIVEDMLLADKITSVNIDGPFDVIIKKGDQPGIKIEYSAFAEGKIDYDVNTRGEARLEYRNFSLRGHKLHLKAVITVAGDLNEIRAEGAATVETRDEYKGIMFLYLEGASKLKNLFFTGDIFTAKLSGASDVASVNLTSNVLSLTLSGASDFHAAANISQEIKMNVSGASEVELAGSSTVASANVNLSGASTANMKGIETELMHVVLSGASKAYVWVTQEATLDLSGASTLYYKGSPKFNFKDLSGASSIKQF